MKIKTSALTGAALDWTVAKLEGLESNGWVLRIKDKRVVLRKKTGNAPCEFGEVWVNYTTVWACCGPIIEREGIDIRKIVTHRFALYEYNEERRRLYPEGEVVARRFSWGPGRWLKVPVPPSKNEGKFMARLSIDTHNFGWKPVDDFLSDTLIVAAMRCYVASKLGAEVEVPDELCS